MSEIFKPITFEWVGVKYTIPADKILPIVADIETKITFMELASTMQNQKKVPIATLSMVYGMVLRYAGAQVSDNEVYAGMFANSDENTLAAAMQTLMLMMMPPGVMDQARAAVEAGEAKAPVKKTSGSLNRASRRSVAAKARRSSPANSGS